MGLTKRAHTNLTILLSLEKDDTIIAKRGVIHKQNDYVQLDNVLELEYSIYFTFYQLLLSFDDNNISNV